MKRLINWKKARFKAIDLSKRVIIINTLFL